MIQRLLFTVLCLFCAINLFAQTHTSEIGLETDNDSYLLHKSDRYYTDGIFIYYRQALKINAGSNLENKVLGFEIGQKIFNPQSGSIMVYGFDNPDYIDRPFAAYLYAGSTLNLLYKNESNLKLGAQIGIIGPSAYGMQTQDFIHTTFGFYHPSGWEYQIDNNAVLNLSAEYNRLLARASWADVSVSSYANLGNGFTGAGIGPMIRLGVFNQLFNSESTQSTAIQAGNVQPLHSYELFFYYKPQFNYVAYDATIQGGLFTNPGPNSMQVTSDPERIIWSNQLGLAYSGKRFVADVAAIFHTKDTEEMIRSHQWGAITLLYRFN